MLFQGQEFALVARRSSTSPTTTPSSRGCVPQRAQRVPVAVPERRAIPRVQRCRRRTRRDPATFERCKLDLGERERTRRDRTPCTATCCALRRERSGVRAQAHRRRRRRGARRRRRSCCASSAQADGRRTDRLLLVNLGPRSRARSRRRAAARAARRMRAGASRGRARTARTAAAARRRSKTTTGWHVPARRRSCSVRRRGARRARLMTRETMTEATCGRLRPRRAARCCDGCPGRTPRDAAERLLTREWLVTNGLAATRRAPSPACSRGATTAC